MSASSLMSWRERKKKSLNGSSGASLVQTLAPRLLDRAPLWRREVPKSKLSPLRSLGRLSVSKSVSRGCGEEGSCPSNVCLGRVRVFPVGHRGCRQACSKAAF